MRAADQCSGTHHARFQGAVERGVFQAIVSDFGGGFAEGQDFGVRGGIVAGDRRVGAAADDFVFDDDNSAHRDFSFAFALTGQAQGFAEELFVSGGNASPP